MAEPNSLTDETKTQKSINPEDQTWHITRLNSVEPEVERLFEKYSNIPSIDVVPHINTFRDKAFKVHPYPCLARFTFLEMGLAQSAPYAEVLQRVKDGNAFLDLGCCLGQDIRKLVFDGAPSENTYGSDLKKDFMDIGYDLFMDKVTLKTTFIGADIFDTESELKQLTGKIDIVHTAFFFHLFDEEAQAQAMRRVLALFKDRVGCLLVGRQLGNLQSGTVEGTNNRGFKFRQNAESFAQMWKSAAEGTGTEWKVEASLGEEDLWEKVQKDNLQPTFITEGTRVLNFAVRRVA